MKSTKPYQMTLGLPFTAEIMLEDPLYYFKEKSKFGTICKFCLSAGRHKVELSEIGENLYMVTCEDGNLFTANDDLFLHKPQECHPNHQLIHFHRKES